MRQQYTAQLDEAPMTQTWKQWEGQVVNGEFHLRRYLGGSDHSAVFLTDYEDREPRQAAIKLILENPANADLQLPRWELATTLSHPHLLDLYQIGRCQIENVKLLYAVMEYAEEDLSQIVPQRPLAPEEVRDLFKPTLEVLDYLHGKGLVHGHIKPANIMACGEQLKLSIDGLCRVGDSIDGLSVYDPPERECSPAADMWALGVTLVEVLTQRLPEWQRLGEDDPCVPDTLPEPFGGIARDCLRRAAGRRLDDAGISSRLRPLAADPERKPPSAPGGSAEQSASAKSRYIVPAIGIGLLLAAALVVPRLLKHRPENSPLSVAIEKQEVVPSPSNAQGQETSIERTMPKPAAPKTAPKIDSDRSLKTLPPSTPAVRPAKREKSPITDSGQGEVVHQVLPEVPQSAQGTLHGTVRVTVKVHVIPSGRVESAVIDSSGPSVYFAKLALKAAQQWEFSPAQSGGESASSDWILRFDFSSAGARVVPVKISH